MHTHKDRKDKELIRDLTVCTVRAVNQDAFGLSPRRRAVYQALCANVTPRQRQCLYLYYGRGLDMDTIAALLHVHPATVCRNIIRGEGNVEKALAFFDEA